MAQLRIFFQTEYLRTKKNIIFLNSPIKNVVSLLFFFFRGKVLGWEQVKSYKVFTPAQSPTQRTDGNLSLWATWAGKDSKSLGNISKYLPQSAASASLGKNKPAHQRCSQGNSSGRWFMGQEGPLWTGWSLTAHTQPLLPGAKMPFREAQSLICLFFFPQLHIHLLSL